jgi:hypothetical protein
MRASPCTRAGWRLGGMPYGARRWGIAGEARGWQAGPHANRPWRRHTVQPAAGSAGPAMPWARRASERSRVWTARTGRIGSGPLFWYVAPGRVRDGADGQDGHSAPQEPGAAAGRTAAGRPGAGARHTPCRWSRVCGHLWGHACGGSAPGALRVRRPCGHGRIQDASSHRRAWLGSQTSRRPPHAGAFRSGRVTDRAHRKSRRCEQGHRGPRRDGD